MGGSRKQQLCVVLVGAGRMGSRWAQAVSRHPQLRMVHIIDPNKKQGEDLARHYGAQWRATTSDVATADLCIVAVPHHLLVSEAKKAFRLGLHVLVEKPGAMKAIEITALKKLARAKEKVLMVGFNYRYFAHIARAKTLIERGTIGRVIGMRLSHGHAGRASYGGEWRMNPALSGGGVLMDQGVHLIDLVCWFMPAKKWDAVGARGYRLWRSSAEDLASVTLTNEHNQIASLFVDIAEWEPLFAVDIVGDKGLCKIRGLGRKYGAGESIEVISKEGKKRQYRFKGDADTPLTKLLDDFIGSVRGNAKGPIADDARVALSLVESLYKRHRE